MFTTGRIPPLATAKEILLRCLRTSFTKCEIGLSERYRRWQGPLAREGDVIQVVESNAVNVKKTVEIPYGTRSRLIRRTNQNPQVQFEDPQKQGHSTLRRSGAARERLVGLLEMRRAPHPPRR